MQPGRAIAGRFDIEEEAGLGGVGTVFRARDTETGALVALKIIRGVTDSELARFAREARVLSELRHPGVVRYIAHGTTDRGEPYLVLEWLDGEDLRVRLARSGLTMDESLALGRRAAEALSVVHAQGLLHRDIKPGNLFLPGGRADQVKLIDFGLVRHHAGAPTLTRAGVAVGTPGYMAPEQARGQREIDARADLFSLGCVLFKCLTGRAPFDGSHLVAVMTRVILSDAPRVRDLRAAVPLPLAELVDRLLRKDPAERPASADEVLAALHAVDLDSGERDVAPAPESRASLGLTTDERRMASVLLIGAGEARAAAASDAPTLEESAAPEPVARLVEDLAAQHGGHLERLADGTRVVTLVDSGAATDQATSAARFALGLRALLPGVPIALATGRSDVSGRVPVGDALEGAARLLGRAARAVAAAKLAGRPPPSSIAIDEVTAGLLDGRFEVRREATEGASPALDLHRMRDASSARTLLGKATRVVGREWELSAIVALFRECVDGPATSGLIVTAQPGVGKSRLAQEVLAAIRADCPDVVVWTARADSVRAGSAFALLGAALEGVFGIHEDEPLGARQRKIRGRVALNVPAADAARVAEFMGEIVGTPFPDEGSAALRTARLDARIMSEQMRRAWEELVAAECAAAPVLLVLEDLHWGDLPTVRFVDVALGAHEPRPFMVLALARPEVHELFPGLWAARNVQEIRLKPLTRRASEALVDQVLGASVTPEVRAEIASQADGNAFYLEELIRAAAQVTEDGERPETVLAMVEARLGRLDADARRLLRAASIFGEAFWPSGVAALLGGSRSLSPGASIDALIADEVIVRRSSSRFAGEPELAFRHALLRDGAYAMLTEGDRALGHALAGGWLEEHGERDPMVLAQHFERGGDAARAASGYLRAAELALRGMDVDAAIARAERAMACDAGGAARIECLALLSDAYLWRFDPLKAMACAEEVTRTATPGSRPWFRSLGLGMGLALILNRPGEIVQALTTMTSAEPTPDARASAVEVLAAGVLILSVGGQFEPVRDLLRRIDAILEVLPAEELAARGWASLARCFWSAWKLGDPSAALCSAEAARALFAEAGDRRQEAFARVYVGLGRWQLGDLAGARRELDVAVAEGALLVVDVSRTLYLGAVLVDLGALDEARRIVAERRAMWAESAGAMQEIWEGEGRWVLGEIARRSGDLEAAERELHEAAERVGFMPLMTQVVAATTALVLLARGRAAEALAQAKQAMDGVLAQGGEGMRGALVRLAHAEALHANGDVAAARVAIGAARDRILEEAARIDDPALRTSFVEAVPENARTLALAQEWMG